jgi:hypothetical protein
MRELVEMNYLMTEPIVLDDSALTKLIGPIAKTSYEEGIRQCMAAALGAAYSSEPRSPAESARS